MSEKTAARTREKWVDDVKVIACILVVLGHFFQSMTKSNILPENGLYQWFNTTIYYFHVPLFFICSGYLYQKYSKVNSVGSWCKGSEIGERCRISIANSLEIGEKVLLSPNVYITDCDHEYRDVDVPVIDQGIVQRGQKVSIGEGSYIGINAVIVGNVRIGRHCVVGANSVVTKDVPDYCVAVGSPAKVIKNMKN